VGQDDAVDAREVAQAEEFVRALRAQLRELASQLARAEVRAGAGGSALRSATRVQTTALRQDIREAHVLIDRLERRYLKRCIAVRAVAPAAPSRVRRP
jgi:hypothetical protein